MKTILISLFAMSTLSLLSSCASTSGTARTTGVKAYPLKTCIVTGNELGSMGDIITIVHQGQEVKFCCKPCVKKFQADPAKYLAQLP